MLTRDIDRLGAFYRAVRGLEPSSRGAYMEFDTSPGLLSLWSLDEFEQTGGATATEELAGGSIMLEFQVDDVDAEYVRLRHLDQIAISPLSDPSGDPVNAVGRAGRRPGVDRS